MNDTQIKEWFRRLKNGRVSVDSEPRSGRPSSTLKKTRETCGTCAIRDQQKSSFDCVRELEEDFGIRKIIVSRIFN